MMPFVSIFFQHPSKVISQIELFSPSTPSRSSMRDPTQTATTAYHSPKLGTQVGHESVKGVTEFSLAEHLSKLKETVSQARY